MSTFNEAAHPRKNTGTGAGRFINRPYSEPDVAVTAVESTPQEQYREAADNAHAYCQYINAVDRHRDSLEDGLETAALKSIGLGLKDAYPDARYLRIEEDDNRFWATAVTDSDGNLIEPDGGLDEVELFGEADLSEEIHALSCTDKRWADAVSPDDSTEAGLGLSRDTVLIDLDKAAALELVPIPSRIEAEIVTQESRSVIQGAVDDSIYYLNEIVAERADEYTRDELEDIRQRIADLKKLMDR